mmetsp:Transcript_27415/g.57210  ORF Transcript_27415/g.57210 Transcript_27415/m.57210 type:complete len:284 (-) Transcript_27415:332-1183(-)
MPSTITNQEQRRRRSSHNIMNIKTTLISFLLLACSTTNQITGFTPPHRGECRYFLDTGDTSEWDALLPLGLFHGVTTNPTLLERANEPCTVSNLHRLATKALCCNSSSSSSGSYPPLKEFMCQTWGATPQEMYENGMAISAMDRERIVIKVPVTKEGAAAATLLGNAGVRICLTACYDHKQALIAGSMGVEYIAPYLGRMTDNGKDGLEECKTMDKIVKGLGSDTRILVASIRDAETLAELAVEGLDTYTFSPAVARMLFDEPLTEKAAGEFEEAAARGGMVE